MYAIYHDLWIEASAPAVYEAVASPDHLVNWRPFRCSGTPEPECRIQFYFTPEFNWYGEVIKYAPNRAFTLK